MRKSLLIEIFVFFVVVAGISLAQLNDTNETVVNETTNTTNDTGEPVNQEILVMKHICPSNIQSLSDFNSLGGFVEKEIACPVVVLPNDEASLDAISGGEHDFDFDVEGSDNTVQSISSAGFIQSKACENEDIGDLNNDGNISNSTCLDTSHYAYINVKSGNVVVTESEMPEGTRFGAVSFTPNSLMANNDEDSLVSAEDGVITLDTSGDSDDSIMLHVYNFRNLTGTVPETNGTNQSNSSVSVELGIMQWYPKGPDYVFVCNPVGFNATSYTWFYGDGHKLLGIANQNTYHVYEALGHYTVSCSATDGVNTASDTLEINVNSLVRPSNPLFGGARTFSCKNDANGQNAACSCANDNENAASCKCMNS
ncbi:MAG TPA: PKD domain-containing protein [Candidatus Nanoarchaeia archaeon]|nr:PKD domain-containing protein [Candidatus Nanoarchaeia archaeon]